MKKQKKHFISLIIFVGVWLIAIFSFVRGGYASPLNNREDDSLRMNNMDLYQEIPVYPIPLDSIPQTIIPVLDSLCLVSDSTGTLDAFFYELDQLQQRKDTVISIVHLGDSHIQAGFYTGRTMRRLQEVFGNAGRGWVAPLKLSKVNEPDDYYINSVVREWVAGRCIQQNPKAPVGIGGIGIQTASPSVNFDVIIGPVNGAGYSFNQAVLYRCEKSMPMLPAGVLKDSIHTSLASEVCVPGILADTFFISCLTDTLQLHSTRRKQGTDSLLPASAFTNTYFGLKLTNGGPGLLYHSIGVNGAMFIHYTNRIYLEQLAALKPSFLIISLGTNETFGRRFNKPEFKEQVSAFVSLVKEVLPNTTLMLTTPAECYKRVTVNKKRTYTRNENVEKAAQVITEVARDKNIACWDLFTATGGKDSNKKWFDNKLMGRDRIHFTKEGYRDQGELLYRALMKNYNRYVETQYPIEKVERGLMDEQAEQIGEE